MPDMNPSAALLPTQKATVKNLAPDASRGMTLFVMIVATLYFGKEVLVPVTLALLLAFLLAPLVGVLRRLRLGRVPAVLLGVVLALGVVLSIGAIIGTQIAELSTNIPNYIGTVESKISTVREYTVGHITKLADSVGIAHEAIGLDVPPPPVAPAESSPRAKGAPPRQAVAAAPSTPPPVEANPLALAERYLSPILSPLATFGIVFVVAVFALLQREDLRDRLIRMIGSDDLRLTTLAIDDGGRRLSRYFVAQLSINASFGVVVGIGLLIIGVPNPVLWAILSALLRFVPYIGSPISALLPMALAAAVDPGWSMVLWTAAFYFVIEAVTGQAIEPLVYGNSTGLSPFSVVVAAIFWSWVWGPIGLILSTPLTLCLVVMGRHVKRLKFLDIMLGDRPALTPVESFYQRILADDADEAEDHADRLLKGCSLSTYYDEVALKGLQMAAEDARRGALDPDHLERIKATIKALVDGLARHDDKEPSAAKPDDGTVGYVDVDASLTHNPVPQTVPEDGLPESWREPSRVLCIAGRGQLDEAASWMLAQLLEKHGLEASAVSYDEVSRDQIATLDMSKAAMACISYLAISGSPAHLRYLIHRLRQHLPKGTPILVGLWPDNEPVLTEKAAQTVIGADYFTSSLGESVSCCVEAARKAEEQEARRVKV